MVRAVWGPISSRANSLSMAVKSVRKISYLKEVCYVPMLAGNGELSSAPLSMSFIMSDLLNGVDCG